MIVCRHGLHNGVMAYMLQIGESTIHIIFKKWVFFMESIFSCLYLKPNDRSLPDSMP